MKGFGEVLKGFRTDRGMSQRELGERVGLHFTYINKIEKDVMNPPSEEKLLLMEEILGLGKYNLVLFAGKIPNDFKSVILLDADVQDYLKERVKVWDELHETAKLVKQFKGG